MSMTRLSVYGLGLLAAGLAGCGMFKKEGGEQPGQPAAVVIKAAPKRTAKSGSNLKSRKPAKVGARSRR